MFFASLASQYVASGTTYLVTNNATLVSAFAAAVAGDTVQFNADIPAPASNTMINFAPGITVQNDGTPRVIGSAGQSFGYLFQCLNATGITTLTTWKSGLTFHVKSANSTNLGLASFFFANGTLSLSSRFTGLNGATPGSAGLKQVRISDSVAYPVVCDLYGNIADTGSADLVSIDGHYATATGLITDHHVNSRVDGHDLVLYSPGSGGSDNWFTGHGGIPCRLFGGNLTSIGGGPGINSAPVNGTMELYGVAMNVAGWTTSTSADCIAATKIVGCAITGAPTSTAANNWARVAIYGDANKTGERSCFIGGTSTIPVVKGNGHAVGKEPVIGYRTSIDVYSALRAVSDSLSGIGEHPVSTQAIGALMALNSLTSNTATVRNTAFRPGNTWPVAANCDLNAVSSSAGGRSGIFPSGGSTDCHSWDWTGSTTVYGIRVDTASGSLATNCSMIATSGAQFGGSAANAVNCTTDGSTPSGASVGTGGLGAQLTSGTGLAMYNSIEAYLTANAIGTGAGTGFTEYTSIATTMAAF
jgi:hypothetical protein